MKNSTNIELSKKKFYIYEITLIFIIILLIITNLLYLKIYPFPRNIFANFFVNVLSSSSSSTTTSVTKSTTRFPSTLDINERLCNDVLKYRDQVNSSNHPCERLRCSIVIHSSGGRLGNRMFLFASAYGLARTHGCYLYAAEHITKELSNNFNMSMKENVWLRVKNVNSMRDFVVIKTTCNFLPEILRPNAFKRIELQGYWQSYLYFDAYRNEIHQMYSARHETLKRLAEYFFNITKIDCQTCSIPLYTNHNELRHIIRMNYNITWIGIHIRLTDFQGLQYASSEYYIYRAIKYYKQRFYNKKLRFLIASDDKPSCEKLFINEQEILILPRYFPPIDDLIALSFCHHSIVTGGTYGFWAAYLAGGEVIHDVIYPVDCSQLDYYPPWFKLVGQTKKLQTKSQIIQNV